MSIEQLKADLAEMIKPALKSLGPTPSGTDLAKFFADQVLPWFESLADELGDMDEALGEMYHEADDRLHTASAAVFAGLIASSEALAAELRTRIGNDQRLAGLIKANNQLCQQAKDLLEEIVVPDDVDPDDLAPETPETPELAEGKTAEGKAP